MEKEKNSLLKNSIYNVSYKILSVLFPLIMSAYASHIILAKGIGKVSSAQNIVQYFLLIAMMGIPEYGIREIAKAKNKSKVFSELFIINFISTICWGIIYYFFVYYFGWFGEEKLYKIVGLTIFLNIINIDWYYQGIEEYKYISVRSFWVKIISLIILLLIVNEENDYANYALINILATSGNYILNIIYLKKNNIIISFKNIDLRTHLKSIFILLCTTVSIELYTLLDVSMLTYFCSSEIVGYYTMAMKIPRMIIVAITGISGVLLPRLSRYYSDGNFNEINSVVNIIINILVFFFVPLGIGICVVAPHLVIVLFGESFVPGIGTLRIASLLIYTLGFSNLFGTQILLTVGEEKKLLLSTIMGAFINICFNLILIPTFQQNGATLASVLSEGGITLLTMFYAKKYVKISVNRKILLISVISTGMMGMVCVLTISKYSISIFSLFLTVFMGIVTYFITNVILKNPIILMIRQKAIEIKQ